MIITLIGSARFEPWFKAWNEALSLAGHLVFSLPVYPSDKREGFTDPLAGKQWYTEEQKAMLDQVHKQKISRSDAVVLLNPFAYIGESTLSDVSWAKSLRCLIYPLESWGKGLGLSSMHHDSLHKAARRFGVEGCVSPIDTTTRNLEEMFSSLLGPAGENRSALIDLLHRVEQVHGGRVTLK